LDFIHPDSQNSVKKRLERAQSGGPYLPRQEEKLVGVDGHIFYTEVTGIKITFGGKEAIAAFIWDISRRKKLEEKSRKSEKFIRTLFTSLPVGVYFKDLQGKYRYINEPYARLTGQPLEKTLGKTALECWPEAVAENFHQEDLDLMKEKKHIVVSRILPSRDGNKTAGFLHLTPVPDPEGHVMGSLGVFIETTEINRAWQALEEEKKRLLTLINASPDIICFKDGKGRWLLANRADLELFHLTGVDYRGKTDLDLAPLAHPIYRQAFEICMASDEIAWKSGKISRSEEDIPTPDGRSRIFDIYKVPLFNSNGTRKGIVVIGRDITQARKTREELRESEETSRAILEALPDLVFTLDKTGKFLWHHASHEEKLYALPEQFIGKKIADVLPSEVAEPALNGLKKVFNDREAYTFSYNLEIAGTSYRFECRMVPKGEKEVLAVIRDISERWKYLRELQEKEQKFRDMSQLFQLIADNDPDMLWAKDMKSRFIFTNRAIREKFLFARDVEEPLGKDNLFFSNRIRMEHSDRENWHTFGEACIHSDKIILKTLKPMRFNEYGNVRGKFLYLDVAKAPLYDEKGVLIGTVGSARDVTREKELEAKQKEVQTELSRLATVVQQANQVIVITDLQGHILYANPAFEETTGYTIEEVKGKNPRILQSGRHDKEFYKNLWDTIIAGKTWEGIFINKKKNGKHYYEKAVIFPIRDTTGDIIQYAAVKANITREKKLEEQFLHSQKMEAVGVLAGGVAHDFNNLLNIIKGYSELSLMHMEKNTPGYREFSAILSAGKKAERLINQLLAFSRKQIFNPETLDINNTISKLEKMLRRLIPEDIDISVILSPELPWIEADPGQIEQILINLMVNARDAIQAVTTRPSEKKITLKTEKITLDPSYTLNHLEAQEGLYAIISVTDTGIGMGKETESRIFEPFFTTKETGKGTGLGLSTVFGIVSQNRGFIDVYSKPQNGTTFKIYWPATEKTPPSSNGKIAVPDSHFGQETILFVEDVKELCELAGEALRGFGYTVLEASDGQKALNLIKKKKNEIDLLITDIVMPFMNGDELAEEALQLIPSLKVIYTSGYTQDRIVHNGTLQKGITFLRKPYSILQLSRKIREVLDSRE